MTEIAAASVKPEKAKGPEGLRALDRAVSILYTLAAYPSGISLADLARETGMTVPTAHRILAALRAKALARETPAGLHGLGVSTLVLAGAYLDGLDLRAEARPHLERLNLETNETCHLGSLAGTQIVYIEKIDSTHPVRMVSRVGGTMPAVVTAMGKAMLAFSPDELVEQTISDTKTQLGIDLDEVRLRKQLEDVRRVGYGTDLEENERGICCVGAAIRDNSGKVVAAISVSTPTDRFDYDKINEFGAQVCRTADEISYALGYLPPERIAQVTEAAKQEDD